jgi:drug/metabolite transporter (DMT)-like permease
MFSVYCVFISVLFYFLFNEKLAIRHGIGICLMLACVGFIALSKESAQTTIEDDTNEGEVINKLLAVGFGLCVPVFITWFITASRYWSVTHKYHSFNYTVDTLLMMGVLEVPFFILHWVSFGYSLYVLVVGVIASFCQIAGTCLCIYAATNGLGGPSSAMIQVQGLIHTILSATVHGIVPNFLQCMGIFCALFGAFVMSVDVVALLQNWLAYLTKDEEMDDNLEEDFFVKDHGEFVE